jgi:ferredoxin-NADP reductase/fatty acid desaturase
MRQESDAMAITKNPEMRDVLNQVVKDPRYAEVMRVPVFSVPQVALVFLALGLFGLATWGYMAGQIPIWLAMLANLISVYIAFTPLHDASHRAVSSNGFLNDFLGVLTGQLLLPGVNMTVFRAIHMDHHRFVGQEGHDPDTGFVDLPKWMGVTYLMFADIHWVVWYFRYGRHYWSRKVAFWFYVMLALVVVSHVGFLMSPWWKEFLLLYVVPQRIGLGIVAYTFAHIQHPSGLTWENEPFQSTVYVRGNSLWRRLMFGQEEHTIHHLVPHVPWFKYRRVWELANNVLRKQPIPARGWFTGPEHIALPTPEDTAPMTMRVASVTDVARDIRAFDLEPIDGRQLPEGSAGAHVEVHLGEGLVRQYSLVAHDTQANFYRIAVKLDANSRGGSRAMHALKQGDEIAVGRPRNNFVLYETAPRFVLVAGGIGITPLLPMAARLHQMGKQFELHVCTRDDAAVPFREHLESGPIAGSAAIHLDGPNGRSSMDVAAVLGSPGKNDLLYICGPRPFMDWLRGQAAECGWDDRQVRIESFAAELVDDSEDRAFDVELARSGRTVRVSADRTIIDALALEGIEVKFACMQGTCGTCATDIVDGEAEHRDAYFSDDEKAQNQQMCLCVSRARGDKLVLDI